MTVPLVDGLAERKVRPDELFADTAYGSGRNAFEASRRGRELVSPVAGSAPGNSHEGEGDGPPPLTGADFQIDVTGEQATVCPAGHRSVEEYELEDAPERVEVHQGNMRALPRRSRCPVRAYEPGEVIDRPPRSGASGQTSEQARPRAWALAGATSGAACRLPQGVGVQSSGCPCTPGWTAQPEAGTVCCRSLRAPLHNFHRAP